MTIIVMGLRIENRRTIIKWALWAVVALVFLVFWIRVMTFESSYYDEKDGSERVVVAEQQNEAEEEEELIEVKPTEEEVYEYVVAADRPRYLTIEKLGISNARILPMGVNAGGELDTPRNIFDVGWYEGSGKPGQGGTMIIDGHNGGPHVHGVFKDLPELVNGDIIQVERGDNKIFKYKVVESVTIPLSDADQYMPKAAKSPESGKESLTVITCTGEWSQTQRTYLSRQFVRAVLLES